MSSVEIPGYFAFLYSRRAFRIAGLLGALGSLIAAGGDYVTGFTVATPPAMSTVMWLSLPDFVDFLAPKSQVELMIGHYLGVLFIPLNVVGLWHVYLALAPGGPGFAILFLGLGAFLSTAGAVFHGMVGLSVTAIRVGDPGTAATAAIYFEPFAWILTVVGTCLFLALAYTILKGRTLFPRWMALISPAVMQLWLTLLAYVGPLPLGVFVLITGFNLSVFFFFAISTARLWHHDPLNPAR